MSARSQTRILVVGAGPAGLAAAIRAAESGARVTLIDDNPRAGGQIWRNQKVAGSPDNGWFNRLSTLPVEFVPSAQVIACDPVRRTLLIETPSNAYEIVYDRLVLATGARELLLPFPGWTLPNIMAAGGLQALAKSGLSLDRKRVVVAGSGPLLLATAAFFHAHGAIVKCIAEQASWSSLLRFAAHLLFHPAKLWQTLQLRATLAGIPYLPGCWVESAHGARSLEAVRLRRGARSWFEPCDYLALSYGLTPNLEVAQLLGCARNATAVSVDAFQRTSIDHVYAAGECTGIGGADLALLEGQIAGYAAAGELERAKKFFSSRRRAQRFANLLTRTFALRPQLLSLVREDTIICRCEDVIRASLESVHSWRSAKLHHRCGMGPCQGRICGPIVEALFGWEPSSIRPPIFPARLASLITEGAEHS
ncbi:MAG TPA: FAD/NAD(P)-binding oxidoreductase [Bryobacteraceae bacterium]|jgi:NADPH-dependent 2,4-dienoyl-CoA reductase/sulfur reductase-like enzyme|nr:FAD/NAD(P)-binding oxidoreductase [Bryobacteraceae bacterium]